MQPSAILSDDIHNPSVHQASNMSRKEFCSVLIFFSIKNLTFHIFNFQTEAVFQRRRVVEIVPVVKIALTKPVVRKENHLLERSVSKVILSCHDAKRDRKTENVSEQ